MKKHTTILLTAFIILAAFQSEQEPEGKKLYVKNCLRCHGVDGSKGFLGEGKLVKSRLDDPVTIDIIKNGKHIMPSFKRTLTEAEIKSLVVYIKSLRKEKT